MQANNITVLASIVRHISTTPNLKIMKSWSTRYRTKPSGRKSWYLAKMSQDIRKILSLISGDDITEMLKGESELLYFKFGYCSFCIQDVLTENEREKLVCDNYKNTLKNFSVSAFNFQN